MKISITLSTVLYAITKTVAAEPTAITVDPVLDYKTRHKGDALADNPAEERILQFKCDLDNDGKVDLFLTAEKTKASESEDYVHTMYLWDFYRSVGDGKFQFIEREERKLSNGKTFVMDHSVFVFDPTKVFVGYVKELSVFGLLAVYHARKHNESNFVAYVLKKDYFKNLDFPDPKKGTTLYHHDDNLNVYDLPKGYLRYVNDMKEKTVAVP